MRRLYSSKKETQSAPKPRNMLITFNQVDNEKLSQRAFLAESPMRAVVKIKESKVFKVSKAVVVTERHKSEGSLRPSYSH